MNFQFGVLSMVDATGRSQREGLLADSLCSKNILISIDVAADSIDPQAINNEL